MNTLFKHTLIYLFSKGLPGFISFVAILYYSKMLEPSDYGKYSLVISVVGVINIVFCEWFRYGLSRFYPESIVIGEQNAYLLFVKSIINYFTIAIAVITLICFLVFDLFFEAYLSKWLVLLMGLMVFLNFAFNLLTQIFITELRPIIFSKANFLKTIIGVGVSVVLIYLGYNFIGLFVGVTVGFIFSVVYSYFSANFPVKPSGYKFNKGLLRSMALYSLPLTASAGLSFLVSYASRFIIGYFRGVAETGLFTLGYDFTQQTIGVFIGIAATSSLPIAMKMYTQNGNDNTFQSHMSKSVVMLFLIGLPMVVVFAGNSTEITTLLLGGNFKKLSPLLIPVSAIAAFILGIKSFYLDTIFYLKKETKFQTLILFIVVVLDTVLNVIFVPRYGYMASAISNLIVSISASALTYFVVNRLLKTPMPWLDILKIMIAVASMFLFYNYVPVSKTLIGFAIKVSIGLIIFIALLGIFNKKMVLQFIKRNNNASLS